MSNYFHKSGFCHTEDKDENEADSEIIPSMDKWEDIQFNAGSCYEDFVNTDGVVSVWRGPAGT